MTKVSCHAECCCVGLWGEHCIGAACEKLNTCKSLLDTRSFARALEETQHFKFLSRRVLSSWPLGGKVYRGGYTMFKSLKAVLDTAHTNYTGAYLPAIPQTHPPADELELTKKLENNVSHQVLWRWLLGGTVYRG